MDIRKMAREELERREAAEREGGPQQTDPKKGLENGKEC